MSHAPGTLTPNEPTRSHCCAVQPPAGPVVAATPVSFGVNAATWARYSGVAETTRSRRARRAIVCRTPPFARTTQVAPTTWRGAAAPTARAACARSALVVPGAKRTTTRGAAVAAGAPTPRPAIASARAAGHRRRRETDRSMRGGAGAAIPHSPNNVRAVKFLRSRPAARRWPATSASWARDHAPRRALDGPGDRRGPPRARPRRRADRRGRRPRRRGHRRGAQRARASPGPDRARRGDRAARGGARARLVARARVDALRHARAVRDVRGGDRPRPRAARRLRLHRPEGRRGRERARRARRAAPQPSPAGHGRRPRRRVRRAADRVLRSAPV